MVEGETLWIKPFSGYNWYKFHNKTQKNSLYIFFAQIRIIRRIQTVSQYWMYSPDDALVARNIYISKGFCNLLWNVYQVYPEKSFTS